MREIVTSILFTTAALVACAPTDGGSGDDAVARTGAAIEIVDFAGLEPALEAQRGEGQLVNLWAMWCAPCVAELPELIEVARAYEACGGHVTGISYDLMVAGSNADTVEDEVRDFLAARDLADFSVLIYDEDDYDAINERFDLPGEVPVTLAIDREGRIVDRHEGKAGRERFEEMMQKALGL